MAGRLQDKVIVVVGGTSGLGASAVRACLTEGAFVVAVGRQAGFAPPLPTEFASRCRMVTGDARHRETATQAMAAAAEQFGRVDALYHVAGGSGRRFGDGPLAEITDEGWSETLDWNLTSLFYSNRAAVRRFLEQGSGGVILNMGSVLAAHPAPAHFATHAYAAAKAAIIGMTRSAAAYYAPHDIRVNVILPGLFDTPMSQRAVQDPTIIDYVRQRQALGGGRAGMPDDLDGAVVFLLSDESRFMTGQAFAIDGGWSVR